jgi:predicted pyridoxine 5'-phosphate oxidase superfamily flavin-nucleotide-binding protein
MKTSPEPAQAYHAGMRHWQDRFDSRRLADRLDERLSRTAATEDDRAFIESQPMFFLATADADGRPDVSYKGGEPGFVRLLDSQSLAFPSYDGNGMFRSLGNLRVNPAVALLFVDFEQPRRLRVLGRATADDADPLLGAWVGAQAVVRVAIERLFPNCPRYVHRMQRLETSPYVPCEGLATPVPAWKRFEMFRDVLPAGDPAREPPG